MRSTTRKRDKAKSAAPYELAKLLLEAIVDADLFDKSLKVVLRRRRYGSDYATGWWSIEAVRRIIFFRRKANRTRLVTISNSVFDRKDIPRFSKELKESHELRKILERVCVSYYKELEEIS